MFTPIPKRFEDMTFSELIEHARNRKRSLKGMERALKVPCIFPIDKKNHAKGARPDSFYKQQRKNLANNKALEVPPSEIFTK